MGNTPLYGKHSSTMRGELDSPNCRMRMKMKKRKGGLVWTKEKGQGHQPPSSHEQLFNTL